MIEQEHPKQENQNTIQSLPKTYDPQAVEGKWYRFWEEGGYFKPRPDATGPTFVISMPPPNVTGALHLGHAITATIEDILIRYHRMKGDDTLWVPGEDHAGIATQTVVERELLKEGLDRHQLGREPFIERVWQWVHQYKNRIQDQHRRLGASCDWTRERFTLDEGLSRAVREVFVRLYEEGLIYRGERIINWCPRCMSALSDLEVDHEDTQGKLTFVRYPLKPVEGQEGTEYISVATTRPETILGDTAVAVNPRDVRYKDLVGRTAILPVIGREIPIIADEAVNPAFGTGAVKVTPAHDPTDFEIGLRHNLLRVQVIGFDGKMTEEAGPYAGQDRFEARENLVEELQRLGLIVKIEDYVVPLGHCQRCGTIVEPLISKQWFCKGGGVWGRGGGGGREVERGGGAGRGKKREREGGEKRKGGGGGVKGAQEGGGGGRRGKRPEGAGGKGGAPPLREDGTKGGGRGGTGVSPPAGAADVSVDVDALQADRDQLFDRLQRLAAEFDDFRKRNAREQAAFAERANERLVKELIPILDDLGRALEAASEHEEGKVEDGVRLVHRSLADLLRKQGLTEIQTDGKFDPHLHEALLSQPSDAEEGAVIEVVQKGYKLGDKVLRPARVVIAAPAEG